MSDRYTSAATFPRQLVQCSEMRYYHTLVRGRPMADMAGTTTGWDHSDRCGALTRRGTACAAKALPNGRCRTHGGLSTGPRTPEGWERTRQGYRAYVEQRRALKCANAAAVETHSLGVPHGAGADHTAS